VSALLLSAVLGAGVQPGVALAADHLVAVVLLRKHLKGGLNDTSSQAKHKVQGALLLDVVVAQSATILQLLSLASSISSNADLRQDTYREDDHPRGGVFRHY